MTNRVTISVQRQTICKGCRQYETYGDCHSPIAHKGTYREDICPCSVCLVKSMCYNIEGCERIIKYSLKVGYIIRNNRLEY